MTELACPESCQYLKSARDSAGQRERDMRSRELPAFGQMSHGLRERLVPALVRIDTTIVAAHREFKSAEQVCIRDFEVYEALETTIKNIETEDRGIIYEHRALSPVVQEMSRRIRTALESQDEGAEEHMTRTEMIKALSLTRDTVQIHLRRAGEEASRSDSYIRHVSLFTPWPEATAAPLII